jgi:4-hydroxy-tetrahydrodipicolinate reductase
MSNPTPVPPSLPRVLIHGATGRMGRTLLRLARDATELTVVAAVARAIPADAGDVRWLPLDRMESAPTFDAVIDFSLPAGLERVLALCEQRGAAIVCGTTGLEPAQQQRLEHAAQRIPVLWSANFSLGVALLSDLVRRAASALPGWDCDLVESHHVHKRDAPSGTALALGREIARVRGHEPVYHSVRAGDIVGEHAVQFTSHGERIELAHRATDRDIFAQGALHCAARLAGRPPARYSVADLLFATG